MHFFKTEMTTHSSSHTIGNSIESPNGNSAPYAISDTMEQVLKHTQNIDDFLEKNKQNMISKTLSEHLCQLLSEKGISRAAVVRGSLLDRTYVYQIFSGVKTPSRDKLIALAFGMHLSDEETQKMLKLSGNRPLYVRDERDVLILFAMQQKMTIFETNELLFDHNFELLGSLSE